MPYPAHVGNLRRQLIERFRPFGITDDVADRSDEEQMFLSRAVAALAITMETEKTDEEAARAITDGSGDEGIDAVAVEGREIIVVQSKWNDKGNAGFKQPDVAAVVDGLRYLFNRDFERLGPKVAPHVADLTRALAAQRPRVTLVLALVTRDPLHHNIRERLEQQIGALHPRDPDLVSLEIIDLPAMYRAILGARRRVDLDIELCSPGKADKPFPLYYGTVPATTVADWYAGENGDVLTARNVRDALSDSEVNSTIRDSLIRTPEHFLYLNSGITLVCDQAGPKGVDPPDRWAPIGLHLEGASVINGAQTGDAVRAVMESHPDCAARAQVMIRVISLQECPDDFGDRITIAANTQNPIEARDLRSVEPEQTDLREDFQLALDLTYSVKRGEIEPERNEGCTMETAALALAAVHRDPVFAAEAKRNPASLWEQTNYREIFRSLPTAYRVWRCVNLLWAVGDALDGLSAIDGRSNRRVAQVAEHAQFLLTHVLFHTMEAVDLDGEDADDAWQEQLAQVPVRVRQAAAHLIDIVDGAWGRNSQVARAVTLPERAAEVVGRLTALLAAGVETEPEVLLTVEAPSRTDTPEGAKEVSEEETAAAEMALVIARHGSLSSSAGGRSTRAVTTIVEQGLVAEGTRFELRPDTEADRKNLPRWLQEDPRRAYALWRSSKSRPLVWEADGQAYSPSSLVRLIRREAMGNDQQVQGTKYWVDPDGRSLVQIAEGGAAVTEGVEE
ncbi:AIPR family protein [Streptomyces graminilatus]|uniref:AIPR family protein n=1 Tax=Streptomyces graminilatus TaxID=1464070 RepID=UPI000AEDACED|nr:AIPR family protein [Streptomyces graminilatus]